MATKIVTIKKGNTTQTVDIVIPETAGTYNIKATREDGTILSGGNIVVNGKANSYQLRFGMSDGSTIHAGPIETPIVYCKVSYPTTPTGVKRYFIQNNVGSAYYYVDTPTSAGEISVPYGTELCIASYESDGYNKPSINGGEWLEIITVTKDMTITVTAGGVQSFTLTKTALPTGVVTHTVTRTSSPLKGASTGDLSNGAIIYYGDVLTQTATALTGFNSPEFNWSTRTVTGDVTAGVSSGSLKSFTLTIPALPTGVASCTIARSPNGTQGIAPAAQTFSAKDSTQNVTIYYYDTLTIGATAASNYKTPTCSLSQISVTGNVTATITAGAAYAWYTIGNSAGIYTNQVGVTNIRITANASNGYASDSGTFTGLPCSGSLYDSYESTSWTECMCGDYGLHECVCFGEFGYGDSEEITDTDICSGSVKGTYSGTTVTITQTGDARVTKVEVYK